MDLSEKIKLILQHKNISPSLFADEVGIQRSSMSHILAGRNKPSLDIVQKIIRRYPDLGINWILDGEELFSGESIQPVAQHKEEAGESYNKQTASPQRSRSELTQAPIAVHAQPKVVDKIMIFYSDGTFQELKP